MNVNEQKKSLVRLIDDSAQINLFEAVKKTAFQSWREIYFPNVFMPIVLLKWVA